MNANTELQERLTARGDAHATLIGDAVGLVKIKQRMPTPSITALRSGVHGLPLPFPGPRKSANCEGVFTHKGLAARCLMPIGPRPRLGSGACCNVETRSRSAASARSQTSSDTCELRIA